MIGETINQYEITAHLGSGGMGDVYLATDTKLDRQVALKFLPPHLAPDEDVRARFMQEAKAASALNHPNICTIYDIQEHGGRMFIVMEHIDGHTLHDRKDTLSLNQVIEIGAQAAEGLAAAHEKGIVHRDIKTENIMVRKDGIVQIMDFGLAKLHGVSRLTKEGSTLGTVHYMSPEQAQGQDVDHRSDIFSLGVVLFELVTGEVPFKGSHESATMYEIINVDPPPPTAINAGLDPELDRIILECIDKEPSERYQSARELAKDLRRFRRDSGRKRASRISTVRPARSASGVRSEIGVPSLHDTSLAATASVDAPSRLKHVPWIMVAIPAVALGFVLWLQSADTSGRAVYRFGFSAPENNGLAVEGAGNVAISPDGRRLAFCAQDSLQQTHLWSRPIDVFVPQQLPGTEGASYPFWSPDSRYVGFFANGKLKKINVTGGPPVNLCDASSGRGGTWNAEGVIVFSPAPASDLQRVSSAGGVPESVTVIDTARGQTTHRWPWFLPDGNRFLYLVRMGVGGVESPDDSIWVGSLDGTVSVPLMQSDGNAHFAMGHVLFPRDRTLMARTLDGGPIPQLGDPFPVAQEVYFDAGCNNAVFSVSANGTLTYLTGAGVAGSRLIWYNRNGDVADTVGEIGDYGNCALSPDGSRFAVELIDPVAGNSDIWIFDLIRHVRTRLTFDPATDMNPVWSPDGENIVFASSRGGHFDIYRKNASGAGETELLMQSSRSKWPIVTLMMDGH